MSKELLGALAAVISIVSLVPYIRDTWLDKTRPHLFTWIVWTAMTAIAFAGQVVSGGGPGTWATGTTAALCVVITLLAISHGEKQITRSDWLSLVGCAIAGLAWLATDGPLLSIILVTLIDLLAFGPTLRKSWNKPHEETLITHQLSMLKHALSIIALAKLSLATAVYPAAVGLMNVVLVTLLIVRRSQLRQRRAPQSTESSTITT